MYCKNCGKVISEDKDICPYCHTPTGKNSPYNNNYNNASYGDSSSFGWAFLGFLIPILGLILYLVWKDQYPLKAGSVGKGALVSVILGVVAGILIAVILSCSTCAILGQYGY